MNPSPPPDSLVAQLYAKSMALIRPYMGATQAEAHQTHCQLERQTIDEES